MKAAVYVKYGPPEVLRVVDVQKPVARKKELLIRVHATTVTSGDSRLRSLSVPVGFGLITRLAFGVVRPRQPILGTELAGRVEAVGEDVRQFRVGDPVFAFADTRMGCCAQYTCIPEDSAVARKPANLTFEEAAAISFGGTTALHFLRRGKLQRGEKVLINGASGGVGTAAVQLAKYFGADVTGVCSAANVDLVRSLGADRVIDYRTEDFTKNGDTYDVIVDTVGTAPYSRSNVSLSERGRLLLVLAGLPDMLPIPWVWMTSNKRVLAGPAFGRAEDLRFLAELAEDGKFRPVIDRCFALEQIVAAHKYVDAGHKRGNVIIKTGHHD
jgi:NADPH:quinone reductase-like Zn-dependent oxidoreductase